ncbi:hypothetical protein [Peribacillus phoenicis]|uniref:hypothetical protein n=1 Tax=unclassified Peribacillus TaxID=2675266 RepID=UPI0039A15B7B
MKIKQELIVTGISLDGFEIPVPEGLSEILNNAGAWVYKEKVEEDGDNPLKDYDRKVVLEDGKLRTYLTYKGKDNLNNF